MSTRRGRKDHPSQDFDPTPSLGKTIQRLRKAYNMSLGDLSEQSGVAKSIISQIERNETNPTLSTVYRLSRALDTTIDEVLRTAGRRRSSSSTSRNPACRSSKARTGSAGWPSPGP